MDSQAFPTVG